MANLLGSRIFDLFISSFPGFLSIRDENHRLIYLNDSFKNWIKRYSDMEVLGLTNEEIASNLDNNVAQVFQECHDLTISYLYNNEKNNKIIKFVENDEIYYFDIIKFKSEYEGKVYIFTQGKDITKLYNETKHYEMQALTDELTGLYNRNVFSRIGFKNSDVFVYIDLNNFKLMNDKFGHLVGDQILVHFSNLLKNSFRKNQDHVIRIGGDEFLIVVDDCDVNYNIDDKMKMIKDEFFEKFKPYPQLGFSYGCHSYSKSFENTLSLVDKLMYQNKSANKAEIG